MKFPYAIRRIIGRVVHGGESTNRPVSLTCNRSFARPGISLIADLVVALLLLSADDGLAQTVDTNFWVTDGLVKSVVTDGSTIYVGGYFFHVGPATGSAVAIDAGTAAIQRPYPRVTGSVNAVAPDGSGGWYLGGSFTTVRGQPRNNLAHLDAVGNLTSWNPNPNNAVFSLVVSGGTVYAGGAFTSIGGQTRGRIAALDATTGAAMFWGPVNVDGSVRALWVSGGTVYVGGEFTRMGMESRNRIAALDATTGAATAWNPNANGAVLALTESGGTVYVGGQFTNIGGQPRSRIAALDAASGAATDWNPDARSTYVIFPGGDFYPPVIKPPEVAALAVTGSTVYVGGFFDGIGGQARFSIAALDATTGAATSWNPIASGSINPSTILVAALAVSGNTIYACGEFSSIGGQPRNKIAALDAATGVATAWAPDAISAGLNVASAVYALAVSGGTVYAGGSFNGIGAKARNSIAAVDATTGAATSWNPNANDAVRVLAVSGGTVYAGGSFSNIGGQPRNRIAAIDAVTGTASAWDPNPHLNAPGGRNLEVNALLVSGSTVYTGGSFTDIGGQPRNNLAAIDAVTGAATAWDPNVDWPGAQSPYVNIYALAMSGGTVYAGGMFTIVGGQPRNNIAAIDATTGTATAWNPDAGPNPLNPGDPYSRAVVYALVVNGGAVYAGGNFYSIGGQPRSGIAALDPATGAATAWNPYSNGTVAALAVSGGTVYAAGSFSNIGGQARNCIAALDVTSGAATAWDPNANGTVDALAVSGGKVYAGGNFTTIGGQPQSNLAAISGAECPGGAMSFDFTPNTLNLHSMGHWVTGTLEPEPPALPSDIDIASIRLNGTVPVDASAATSIGDADSDGRPDLTVRFDRSAVELVVTEGDAVPVTVTGEIGQGCFSATDVIRVKRGHVTTPATGVVLQGGGTTEVRWDTPAGVQVQSVAVLWSSDDGATWSLVAHELPNTGSYSWSVPSTGTAEARVAVVLVESADESGDNVTGVLGVSGRFTITTPLGVVPGVELALHGPVTNPSARLTVSFSLPDAQPASLAAYDVSGREVVRSAVGTMGAGHHVVTLGTSPTLAPGVYLVHLIRGDRRLVARAVVVR